MNNRMNLPVCLVLVLNYIAVLLLLPSCTIAWYEIRNELPVDRVTEQAGSCYLMYSLVVKEGCCTSAYGIRQPDDRLRRISGEYAGATERILNDRGCVAQRVELDDDTDLKVQVDMLLDLKTLPQDWLTYLSLGLIPSWGTRPEQYLFTFEDRNADVRNCYAVDLRSASHLFLFPFSWTALFTVDEVNAYEKALANFLDSR